jgi:hypothetical protein
LLHTGDTNLVLAIQILHNYDSKILDKVEIFVKKFKMKKIIRTLGVTFITVALWSCQSFEKEAQDIKMGDENPFTMKNFELALSNVMTTNPNGRIKMAPPSTTHNYVQFNPQNEDHVMRLHDIGYDLYETPLDENAALIYIVPDADFVPLFTLIPSNFGIPSDVPHQILGQVVLFDEDAGDSNDPEDPVDPWEPEPPCIACCIDPWICPRMRTDSTSKRDANPMKVLTKNLIEAGVNLRELTDEMFRLSGNEAELDDAKSSNGRTQGARYFPSGFIRVEDNSIGQNTPVKGVFVKSRRWFKTGSTFTNQDGYFGINKGYRNKARIIIKFKNGRSSFRGISGLLKVWEYVFPLKTTTGHFERGALQNVEFVFRNPGSAIDRSLTWVAAHGISTIFETDQYNNSRGIAPPPNQLRIWVSNRITQSASAPMLRSISDNSQVLSAIQYLIPGIGSVAAKIVRTFVPDVTMRVQDGSNNLRSSSNIINTFFHEYAHATHYRQVGDSYWSALISAVLANGGYGNKNGFDAGRIAVAEAWGFYVGHTYANQRYGSVSNGFSTASLFRDQLENQSASNSIAVSFGSNNSTGWIPFGALHDMTDTGEPTFTGISDFVSSYNMTQLFRGFQPNIATVSGLRQEILNRNGNLQASQVNQLITSYNW